MSEIIDHRKKASELSLGLSHEGIYSKAIEILKEKGLKGEHLDFGSGKGDLLKKLSSKFPAVHFQGVDLMERPKELSASIDWWIGDLNESLNFKEESFQSISAIEIIEHLENPRHVFRELYRVLKTGGYLLVSTPNNESWRAIISFVLRGHFVDFTSSSYPAHITPMNRQDLWRAASEAGFKNCEWAFVDKGCVPGMTRWSWQKISFGGLKGLRYSDNLFIILKK